jgi:hypothetical protein
MTHKNDLLISLLLVSVLAAACSAAPEATPTARIVVVTATPPPATSTPRPTITPTVTETVSLAPQEGWERFEGSGFEIWLPDTYFGGSDPEALAAVAQELRDMGENQLAQNLEANLDAFMFYALDSYTNNSNNYISNMNIGFEQNSVLTGMTIEEYANLSISQLSSIDGVEVLSDAPLDHPDFDAHILVSQYDLSKLSGVSGTAVAFQYLLKNGDHVWVLTYITSSEEANDRAPDVATSAVTFAELDQ